MITLQAIAKLLNCPSIQDGLVHDISVDSRKTKPGDLFVALSGERFDGNNFLEEAVAQGAVAVICSVKPNDKLNAPYFLVEDPLAALTKIAVYHRQSITCPVIALTGSNGKTTVKEMIYNILPKPAHATPGNLNNHIGVPLSLLKLNATHRYAVFELGANHLGEIAHTAKLVNPQVALINNIGPAHIGEFGSIEAIAKAKGELFQALNSEGIAVINEDDDYAHCWDDFLEDKRTIRFAIHKPATVSAENILFNEQGCANFDLVLPTERRAINLQLPGKHMVYNALAAATCCFALGIELDKILSGLNQFKGVPGRMTFLKGINQALIIDDTYNANPLSVSMAIDVLAERQGHKILVLGDMGELGPWAEKYHREIGQKAQQQGINLLLTYGLNSEYSSKAFGIGAQHFNDQGELVQNLLHQLDATTTVLIKGSRSAAMEKIVHQLIIS